ncbi:MAG: hypothetical protein LBQ00_03015 [Syntrophobacterales bacterium]|nr:hypothetical protein [Syntrophobacterales bacterium]
MNIFASDPVMGFIYKPFAKTYEKGREYNAPYQINSFGLRDREYEPKRYGVFRVLLLGDSFSASHGLAIEDSLSRQLEKALQQTADTYGKEVKFEVINAAAGGYSPYNYWKGYERWKTVFKPDTVIVGLSPDDYECDNENMNYLVENGEITALYMDGQEPARRRGLSLKRVRKWLSWNSEFYVLMRNFFYYNDFGGCFTVRKSPGGVGNDTQFRLYAVSQRNNVKKIWSNTFSYLRKIREETARDGVGLTVIPIPLKLEIDPKQLQQLLAAKNMKDGQVDVDQTAREIIAFCKMEKIPVLDPRPALRERQSKAPCYFMYDGHWNEEGVRVASISLARQWRDLALPPWGIQKR